MSDIVERLRQRGKSYEDSGPSAHHTAAMLYEAAAEIEYLKRLIAEALDEIQRMKLERTNERTESAA